MTVRATSPADAPPIGFWTSVALVMGNMIGSGVFLLPSSLAPYGGISLLGWIVSAGGSIALALTFAHLARFHPSSGGPYAYTRLAYGDLAGFLVAWGYWIAVWSANAALAVAFVGYMDPFIPSLVRRPPLAALLAIAMIWLLTLVNIRGVRDAGRVQLVTTALKLLPLVLVGLAGVIAFDPSHFSLGGTDLRGLATGTMATATLTLWAFLGLESATIPASSTADAARTIPRATTVGAALTAIVYLVATIGVMSLIDPTALGRSTAPFADAARQLAGDRGAALIAFGAAISCFGALNGWVLVVGQLPCTVAEDGLFPRAFARRSRQGTPAFAMIVAACFSSALVAMNYSRGLVDLFTFIILLSTLSTLVPYAFCSIAAVILRRRNPRAAWPPGAAAASAIAFAYSLFAIAGAGADVVFWGFLLLLSGLPIFALVAGRDDRRADASTT